VGGLDGCLDGFLKGMVRDSLAACAKTSQT